MMKIKCMLDNNQYQSKPQGVEIAKITNKLEKAQIEVEILELSSLLTKGCTFKPSYLSGKKETNWIQQQLFALDFDDNANIEFTLNKCKELNILPCFGYTSFSHTKEHHKFRLVFCANEVITDYDIAKQLQLTLMELFNNCDERCKNLSRLYFGGKELIYKGVDNVIDYKDIINKYYTNKDDAKGKKKPQDNIDYINTFNLLGLKTPTDEKYYNIKALRDRNVGYLKNKINNPKIILENNQAFFDYIKSYNLGELLEISYPSSFRCILHEDNSPSAGIFVNEEGTHIYHCFSCGKSYNIINLIEVLGNFKSRPKAYKFIREIFNLEIMESAWQREQKEIIKENRRMLLNGELEKNCPTAYNNIKRNIKYLDQLLLIAEDNVYSEKLTDGDDNVVFYASTKFICKQLGMSEESAKEVSKKNVLFTYHGLLNKIAEGDIPETMIKRSQAINSNSDNKNRKHINYYSVPSYSTVLFDSIESYGNDWINNSYTMKGLSREMFYRTEGKEIADKLYPQYKSVYDKQSEQIIDRTTSSYSDMKTIDIHIIANQLMTNKGYIVEKEIVEILREKYGKTNTEMQIKKSLKEMLDSYGWQRIRCNKEIKEKYGITSEGYPFIIVKE